MRDCMGRLLGRDCWLDRWSKIGVLVWNCDFNGRNTWWVRIELWTRWGWPMTLLGGVAHKLGLVQRSGWGLNSGQDGGANRCDKNCRWVYWAGLDRSGQICRRATGQAQRRRTGSSTPGRPRQLEGGSSARPKTPESGRNASSDEQARTLRRWGYIQNLWRDDVAPETLLLHDEILTPHWVQLSYALQLCEYSDAPISFSLSNIQLAHTGFDCRSQLWQRNFSRNSSWNNFFTDARKGVEFAIDVTHNNPDLKRFSWINNSISSMKDRISHPGHQWSPFTS